MWGALVTSINLRDFNISAQPPVFIRTCEKWLNENRISKAELLRRMGINSKGNSYDLLTRILKGTTQPRKPMIDKLIKLTGLTYERLFETEERIKDDN